MPGPAAAGDGCWPVLAAGDRLMTHSLPLCAQGAWAEWIAAAATDVAAIPDAVPFDIAAAMPVPALTAEQALRDALGAGPGATFRPGHCHRQRGKRRHRAARPRRPGR